MYMDEPSVRHIYAANNCWFHKGSISIIYCLCIAVYSSHNSITKSNSAKKCSEDLNWLFSKEDIQMANRHMKRCSIIKEMQIKTTRRYHLIVVRMAIFKKSADNRVSLVTQW